jgi:hypothetical protein
MNNLETLIQIVLIAFLAWGGLLSLKCLLRDRTWYTRAGL